MALTLFQLLQHRRFKVIRRAPFHQQPLRQRAMVERPKHVLIVRKPIQRQRLIQRPLKALVARRPLPLPHRTIKIFRDHLGGLVAAGFESNRERVREGIHELAIRDTGDRGSATWL